MRRGSRGASASKGPPVFRTSARSKWVGLALPRRLWLVDAVLACGDSVDRPTRATVERLRSMVKRDGQSFPRAASLCLQARDQALRGRPRSMATSGGVLGRYVRSCRWRDGCDALCWSYSGRETKGHERAAVMVHPICCQSANSRPRRSEKVKAGVPKPIRVLGSWAVHSGVQVNAMRGRSASGDVGEASSKVAL
jgi:hypothetical protein